MNEIEARKLKKYLRIFITLVFEYRLKRMKIKVRKEYHSPTHTITSAIAKNAL